MKTKQKRWSVKHRLQNGGLGLSLSLIVSGCLDLSAKLKVRPDGSAELMIQSSLEEKPAARVLRRAAQVAQSSEQMFYKEAAWRAIAQDMGSGVTCASFRKKEEGNKKKITVSYAIEDIRAFRLGSEIAKIPMQEYGLTPIPWSYRFTYKRGALNQLSVFSPRGSSHSDALSARDMLGGMERLPGFEQMLRDLIYSSRIEILLEVEGQVHKIHSSLPQNKPRMVPVVDIRLAPLLDWGGIAGLLDVKDLRGLYALQAQRPPGLRMQNPKKVLKISFD